MAQPIDSKTAAVGDSIRAIVGAPARSQGADLIPKGALLLGRIRRLERQLDPRPSYLVGLEFTDVEFPGHHARFIGQMLRSVPVAGLALGVSTFFMDGLDFRIPEGMQMTWVTTKLGR
jgi:hypothetical protein